MAPSPSQPALIPGVLVGPYRIVGLLGVGGMGEVYRARDTKLNRDIALKVLPKAVALDPDRLSRFKREAQVLAALNHPHIAAIYGLEESGGAQALVLELVDGPTLADRIAHGPIPPDEVLAIARQIARALEAAHEKGIIHRDLKPANIKITGNGAVKVLDFGLAKIWDGAPDADSALPTMTASGVGEGILGTPAYMSPEQARGKTLDKRTDIWSFGCVLFEMLTGRAAFAGETTSDTIARILEREPDWRSLPPRTSARVRDLLRRCLNKDCDLRLHDVADARIELDDAFTTAADSTAESAVANRQEAVRRRRLQILVTGVLRRGCGSGRDVSWAARWQRLSANLSSTDLPAWIDSRCPAGAGWPDGRLRRDVDRRPTGVVYHPA